MTPRTLLLPGYEAESRALSAGEARLTAAEDLAARPEFWCLHLRLPLTGPQGSLLGPYGLDGADLDAVWERLGDERDWPVLRVPCDEGGAAAVVYRNSPDGPGVDCFLRHTGRPALDWLARDHATAPGRGLPWCEPAALAEAVPAGAGPADGLTDPAERLLLLLALLRDPEAEAPADAPGPSPARSAGWARPGGTRSSPPYGSWTAPSDRAGLPAAAGRASGGRPAPHPAGRAAAEAPGGRPVTPAGLPQALPRRQAVRHPLPRGEALRELRLRQEGVPGHLRLLRGDRQGAAHLVHPRPPRAPPARPVVVQELQHRHGARQPPHAELLLGLPQRRAVVRLPRAHHTAHEHVVQRREDQLRRGPPVHEHAVLGVPGQDEHAAVPQPARVHLAPGQPPHHLVVLVDDVEHLVRGRFPHLRPCPSRVGPAGSTGY